MFEKFTDRGRQVVVLAQEEARRLQHGYIGTEHLLLGLLREEEGLAASSLRSLGLTVERVRAQVLAIVGMGAEPSAGQIPFTPRAKKVLEQSSRESQLLGHHHIGTEHILLALAREREGQATRILLDFDADPDAIRDEVIRTMSDPEAARRQLRAPTVDVWIEGLSTHLDQVGREIVRELGRFPDSGDLLLALSSTKETLGGEALEKLGVDPDALQAAIEHARGERAKAAEQMGHRAEEVRQAKEKAIEAGNFDEAARLRDRQRELSAQPRVARLVGSDALEEFRRRTGLPPREAR